MALSKEEALTRLEKFSEDHKWTYKRLSRELGLDWSESKWTRAFKDQSATPISDDELAKINFLIARKKYADGVGELINKITSTSPDHMYFSLLDFFGYSFETEVETKQLAEGSYILYRPSLKIPDMFTVGMVEISTVENSGALKVQETRVFRGYTEKVNDFDVTERGITEHFEGYMFRKRRRYISIQRSVSPDSPNFVIAIFNDEFVDNEDRSAKILSLGGVVFGTVGSRIYVSKVFLERCEPGTDLEQMRQSLDYIKIGALKPSVRNYLRMNSGGEYYNVF